MNVRALAARRLQSRMGADGVFLDPGNDIVVSMVDHGVFDRVRESLQAHVAPRTHVDFRALELTSR